MKISKYLLIIFIMIAIDCNSQTYKDAKRDYVWPFSPAFNLSTNGVSFDYNYNPFLISSFNSQIITDIGYSSICDSLGNLLFYTNGMFVADRNGNKMPHGDSLNYGFYYDQINGADGYRVMQDVIILPMPGSDSIYYIFHLKINDPPNFGTQLLYSIVNIEANSGLGDVIIKNQRVFSILSDTLTRGGGMAVVRHANGEYWWIIIGDYRHSFIHRALLTNNGILEMDRQNTEFHFETNRDCSSAFSPDGSRYAVFMDSLFINGQIPLAYHLGAIYDFDRSIGVLSNYRNINFIDTNTWVLGACFSPNSRFLYSTCGRSLFQWDADALDVNASKTNVANWDGYMYSNVDPTGFAFPKCGPDGKIYMNAGGATNFIHIIENPDSQGLACNVVQRAITLSEQIRSYLPYHPNFRLGASTGILENISGLPVRVSPIPNPANDIIQFNFNIQNNKSALNFRVLSMLGEIISNHYIAPYQGILIYDVSNLFAGVYLGVLMDGNEIKGNTKFIVLH